MPQGFCSIPSDTGGRGEAFLSPFFPGFAHTACSGASRKKVAALGPVAVLKHSLS